MEGERKTHVSMKSETKESETAAWQVEAEPPASFSSSPRALTWPPSQILAELLLGTLPANEESFQAKSSQALQLHRPMPEQAVPFPWLPVTLGHAGQGDPGELEGSRALCSMASSCQAPQHD